MISRLPVALAVSYLFVTLGCADDDTNPGAAGSAAGAATGAGAGGATASGGSAGAAGSGGGAASSGAPGAGGSAGAAAGAGSGGAGAPAAGCATHATAIYCNDFDDDPVGLYSEQTLAADWNDPPWNNGVGDGRVSIIEGSEAFAGRSLRVTYPAGGVGPSSGGAQWQLRFAASHDELYVAYRVRFGSSFDFVKGGKLPGFAGGAANTGGDKPTGLDGFSARMMWRTAGSVVQYMYYMDQPGNFGEDFIWDLGGSARTFQPGTWHLVEHRVKMNTPGSADGSVEGWFDGVKALERTGVRLRDSGATFGIEMLYFSTFFGGSDATWAPSKDEYIDYDDFVVK